VTTASSASASAARPDDVHRHALVGAEVIEGAVHQPELEHRIRQGAGRGHTLPLGLRPEARGLNRRIGVAHAGHDISEAQRIRGRRR
jgi:hypothetical protein